MRIINSTVDSAPTSNRRGVSLLEIMISIGVVGIGLIGVASLIPLAHYKAAQGVEEERKALFGKRAFREFFVRGFDRPGKGLDGRLPDPSLQRPNWIHFGGGSPQNIHDHQGKLLPQTYCFDPHEISYKISSGVPGAHHFFPNNTSLLIHVPRVTVRAFNASSHYESLLLQTPPNPNALNQFVAAVSAFSFLDTAQADEIFRIRDDLVVIQPEGPDQLPIKSYLSEGTPGSATATKAVTGGSFSWMATLVPERRLDFATARAYANRYVMSIVVFNQRDLSGTYREETVAQVNWALSFFSGPVKEVVINEVDPADINVPENVGVRDIRAGDWIALMQNPVGTLPPAPVPPGTPNIGNAIELRWYEVVAADETDGEFDVDRELSLSGGDWVPNPAFPLYAVYLAQCRGDLREDRRVEPRLSQATSAARTLEFRRLRPSREKHLPSRFYDAETNSAQLAS